MTIFNVQSTGHILQISNVQSAFFMIMCNGCVEPYWMALFLSFLVCPYRFDFCGIIILMIFCWFECILWFCLSFWPSIHYHCMILWAVLLLLFCELSCLMFLLHFSLVFENFFQPYIYCSPFRLTKN